MRILFLSFYFKPDLSAGSFRNTSLVSELQKQLNEGDKIDVYTTFPNRYDSYRVKDIQASESVGDNLSITRIQLPKNKTSFKGQIKSFIFFFKTVKRLTKDNKYDLVYASSSKLFTAFLGANLARKKKAKLYLDIRDIFREGIVELFKNPILKISLDILLKPVERYTFNKADHINLVSKGFQSYFNKFEVESFSFHTNGIDKVFLNKNNSKEKPTLENKKKFKIIYAGNIGEGQGLNTIIPQMAKELGSRYEFNIYGDGGAKDKLLNKLKELDVNNVIINKPIKRDELIGKYKNSDYLFLHLNDYKAFERVLPSKLFEYGAFDKPVIAGVGGYAAEFLKENMSNLILFKPCDFKKAISLINENKYKTENRESFIKKYSRSSINIKMAKSILELVHK